MPIHRSTRLRATTAIVGGAALTASAIMSPALVAAQEPPVLSHIGSFFVPQNLPEGADPLTPTSAEILGITPDGQTVVYTDALTRTLGFIDISDPSAPQPLGALELPGDPTSVAVLGDVALVSLNTSEDPDGDGPLNAFDAPTGELLVIDLASRETVHTLELGGQPDSIAVAPSGRYAAIIIENERDEDEDGGLMPQLPAGLLQILDLDGEPEAWTLRSVEMTGLADFAAEDPEPEYVDINTADQAVVSLQENNHLVIVDLPTGEVVNHFSAGTVDLDAIDTVEEEIGPQANGVIELTGSLTDRRREPDSVEWIDEARFVTANEGDYEDADGVEGGTRGFTIFTVDGEVAYDAGNEMEHLFVRTGHFPHARAANKGIEPEGLEVGVLDGRTLLFVGSERGNAVAVYDVTGDQPEFIQLLPTGIGPEGLKLRDDGLLIVTSEADGPADDFQVRATITLFSPEGKADWSYPQLISADDADGLPIPWVAMSGLSGDPSDPATLWAVSDSYLAQSWLYRIDVSAQPAVITERIAIGGTDVEDQLTGDFDLEGVAARVEGGFWLASEGRVTEDSSRPNLIIRAGADGALVEAVALPETLVAGATNSGFEGVTVTGTEAAGDEAVWVVIQREWADDAAGFAKVGRYEVATGAWTFASYPLDAVESPAGGWVGLSEITALPDGRVAIIERDNQLGLDARVKRITTIDPSSVTFAAHGEELPVLEKTLLRDVLGDLDAASITIPDKLEGFAVTSDGEVYVVTDNDGVDENHGETVFLRLGALESLAP